MIWLSRPLFLAGGRPALITRDASERKLNKKLVAGLLLAIILVATAGSFSGLTSSEVAPRSTPAMTPRVWLPFIVVPPAPCGCSYNQYNCSDFTTHSQAQACFNFCVSRGAGDIHRLDQDNDGIACEILLVGN